MSLFIAAAIGLLVASGVDITPGLATAIDRFVGACLTVAPFVAAYFIRGRVVSPYQAEKMVAQAVALQPGSPVPSSITSKIPGGVAPPPDPPEGVR
ncbi:MAG: hypothetical protein M3P94_03320 [Chloroflexota bacterium]|nr:hypothetical protein [Chloroflexota bacterium]